MADARIENTGVNADYSFSDASRNMSAAKNAQWVDPTLDPNMFRKPDFLVYIFSVADKELIRELPPQLKRLIVKKSADGKTPELVTTIPHPFNQPDVDENGRQIARYHDGRRIAMDIVNPSNTTLNQDAKLDPKNVFAEGNDYGKLGVFWSLNNPPSAEEVEAAVLRKENHYRNLLQQAQVLASSNPKALHEQLTDAHHMAADHFGLTFEWHSVPKRLVECEICQEYIKNKALPFHALQSVPGVLCVRDWDRTIAAGVKKESDRPKQRKEKEVEV